MNVFSQLRHVVLSCLHDLVREGVLPEGLSFDNVTVEPPRDPSHGEAATNAAMVLAKPAKSAPRVIAQALADKLQHDEKVESVDIAGPGFLNMRLAASVWQGVVMQALEGEMSGASFGSSALGAGQKVLVEYVSANPTGPLHIGHTRGAVFGDALASLLDYSGYDVTREYYVNDGGGQVDVLARSVYLRYLEAFGQEVAFAEGTYPGGYLIAVGEALKDKVGDRFVSQPEEVWLDDLRAFSMDAMMALIREDLAALGVEMDNFFSEKALYGTGVIEQALKELKEKGLLYRGVLEPPKGKMPQDWEPREQLLFKSTEHGDDVDRAVQKSDGSWTYFAPDIAYHYDKIKRGYTQLIDIFGADHGGYVRRMKAAVSALSGGEVPLDIKITQLVKLYQDGEPFTMSKRAGTFITLRDVVDRVGADVVRFHMLTRKNDATLDFDLAKVTEQSKDNPVFYVQYANARVHSVLRRAKDELGLDVDLPSVVQSANVALLFHPAELRLAQKLAEWPRLIEAAARAHEPHKIAFYLYELASEFHGLWNKGSEDPSLRFVQDGDNATTLSKIALLQAVSVVICAGLGILGVKAVTEMR